MKEPYKKLECSVKRPDGTTHYYIIIAQTAEDYDWHVSQVIEELKNDD